MSKKHFKGLIPCLIKRSLRLYSRTLDQTITLQSATIPIDILDCDTQTHLCDITEQRIAQRLSAGDCIFVAYHQGNPVGYIFASVTTCWVEEVDKVFNVAPSECYFYDAYTYPAYRGYGIYPALLAHATRFFQTRSRIQALIFTLSFNHASVHGIQKTGFNCYGSMDYYNVFGYRFWRYRTHNGHIQSYFDDQK